LSLAIGLALITSTGPPRFEDVTDSVGINSIRLASGFMPTTAGSAWFDFDLDGDLDLVLGGDEEPVRLLRNSGAPNYVFEDISSTAGLADVRGVISIDVLVVDGATTLAFAAQPDDDLWELQLWRQLAPGGIFKPRVVSKWLSPYLLSHGDLDGDGDHDLVTSVSLECSSSLGESAGLFRFNNEYGHFYAYSDSQWPARGCLAVPTVTDYGATGRPATLFTSDYGIIHSPTTVIHHDRVDRTLPRVYGMGIAVGDVNFDRVSDYVFTSIREDAVWASTPNGFERRASPTNTDHGTDGVRVKWAATYLDANNDGGLEFFATSGFLETSAAWPNASLQRSILIHDGVDVAEAAGVATETRDTTVVAADYDQDGRVDLLVGAVSSWYLFRNVTEAAGHFVEVAIENAPGARAVVDCGGTSVMAEFTGGVAGSAAPPVLHFGLGTCTGPIDVTVSWPWGGTTTATGLDVDTIHRIERGRLVHPKSAPPGSTIQVQWIGEGSATVNGTPLVGDPPSASLVAPAETTTDDTGPFELKLVVDGETRASPTVRIEPTDAWHVRSDPAPLPRDVPATVLISGVSQQTGDTLTVSGGDILTRAMRNDGQYEIELTATDAQVTISNGETSHTLDTVGPVDPAASEVSARLEDNQIVLRILPVSVSSTIPPMSAEQLIVLRDGQPVTDAEVRRHELNGFVATVERGGTLSIRVTGTDLDTTIDSGAFGGAPTAESLLFPLYETARADGQDIVTLVLLPVGPAGHVLADATIPDPTGLEVIDSWRPISIGQLPMWEARLRTTITPGPVSLTVGALETTVVLVEAAHPTVSAARTTVEANLTGHNTTEIVVLPRDESGHLVGSGADVRLLTSGSGPISLSYIGAGQYRWQGEFCGGDIEIDGRFQIAVPTLQSCESCESEAPGNCSTATSERPSRKNHGPSTSFWLGLLALVTYRFRGLQDGGGISGPRWRGLGRPSNSQRR
jgi:hypothetical protein